ncbi:MAG: hypothetical protein AMJ54_15145 [Deltaproteobacteria bacterium SG8_13]|nr:MAG: hypothetical protein AMJ54_15145 [Deltaproteobacteria bacterium SG8_13]
MASCRASAKNPAPSTGESGNRAFYVVGHRGAAGLAPENTLSSFARACELGVDAVELDALLTADKEVVVHHDFRLKPALTRSPDGDWLKPGSLPVIKDLRLDELKTYDVGRLKPGTGYARRYPEQTPVDGERIPTLREVIRLLKQQCGPTTQLWVEIKTSPEAADLTPAPETVSEMVIEILRGEKISDRTRILSFDWRNLVHVQKIAPDIPTVYLSLEGSRLNNIKSGQPGASPWMAGLDIDDFSGSIPHAIRAAGGRYWASYYKQLTVASLRAAHELGMEVYVWTPDAQDAMKHLIEMGVDGIITNRPDRLIRTKIAIRAAAPAKMK